MLTDKASFTSYPNFIACTSRFIVLFCLCCMACQKETKPKALSQTTTPGGTAIEIVKEHIPLRASPGMEGKVIAVLQKNSTIYDQGRVSDFVTFVQLYNQEYFEPWMEVKTEEGTSGWIFACKDFFDLSTIPGIDSLYFLEKRFQAYFGTQLFNELITLNEWVGQVNEEADFIKTYTKFVEFKKQLSQQLYINTNTFKDLFWIAELIPGIVPQRIEAPPGFSFFTDYRYWGEKALATDSKYDDDFIDICYHIYPEDSIEYDFPGWVIQVDHYKSHSLLGRKIHIDVLEQIEALSMAGKDNYKALLSPFIKLILNDLTQLDNTYWEERTKIEQELKLILGADFSFFTAQEKSAITNKLKEIQRGKLQDYLDYQSGKGVLLE